METIPFQVRLVWGMLVERWHLSSVWLTAKHINIITDIAYAMSCGNLPFVCALCTLFHMVSCLRENMENVMQLEDTQSRSYFGSYLDVLKGLQRIDECDGLESLEKSKCSGRQVVSAFSKDLQEKNCEGTKPKFQQTASTADSGDTEKVLQELCEAAVAVNSGDPRKEEDGKRAMEAPLEEISKKMIRMNKIKEAGATALGHLIAEDFYIQKTLDFFGVNISDPPAQPLSLLGEGVELMSDVVQGQFSGKKAALFALKAAKLALKIGGSLIPFPGNVLAAKLVDLGIQFLSEESAEALEDTIDRIATAAVHRGFKTKALREAKIFVDYAEQQIHFHDSLDDGFAHLEGISHGEYSTGKNLAAVLSAETAFNRWLIIENALAAALHKLVPPERPDARTEKDLGSLQPVEERAEFFVVVVDHFLLYLLVLSKMADKVQMEGPEHKLHDSLQERAREMAKLVLPSLAVMFEKQWGNPWVSVFYKPADPEYYYEAFLQNVSDCQLSAARCWWKEDPNWGKEALKNFQAFSNQKESQYTALYANNTEALATKLKGILHNKFLYPQELHLDRFCSSYTDDPESFHHGARTAEFILKCLFYPLLDAVPVQDIVTYRKGPSRISRSREGHWRFQHAPKCTLKNWRWEIRSDNVGPLHGESTPLVFEGRSRPASTQVFECAKGQDIIALHLYTSLSGWKVVLDCGVGFFRGLHKIENTGYTFSSFLTDAELTFEVPCASDYAVLEKVEYGASNGQFKTTCRYAYFTKAECQKNQ